ncbi:probable receptor-like serine/threonine-protein kinase At5g57670 [Andrographis paniculata]|uniref:probable receptor-like serine/threonine-protein kinase At5g57670 n=1 Tax=Andrographis paniculata TaxID=175694 RepID=UPI0021E765EB|nr:probable receptor-like serine/threonine-protein kinase At5g57670 [Andrographis paniculata]
MRYIQTPRSLKRLFSLRRRPNSSFSRDDDHQDNLGKPKEPPPSAAAFQKPTWKCFSYDQISAATAGFSSDNLVGRGGYAEVYRGVLEDGEAIAVKRVRSHDDDDNYDERKEKEFLSEIGTLGHVSHPNVTPLLGCCIDNGLYLVFRFSSRGSVASILHDQKVNVLDWRRRYKIAVGTARGLHYLHNNCPRRIIHRDIKASNVLLAADFEPQISDFGLAKWLPSQWSHRSIAPIEGTFGHLAPEYFMHGVVDEKTDVFAFGVFLLELLSGKKPVDNSHQSLHSWAKPILVRGDVRELIDPRLGEDYDVVQLNRVAFAALLCIRSSPISRPTMTEVLEVLSMEGEMDTEKWEMPEEEEGREEDEDHQHWGLEDLGFECEFQFDFEFEFEFGDDENESSSTLLDSPRDSFSTGRSTIRNT